MGEDRVEVEEMDARGTAAAARVWDALVEQEAQDAAEDRLRRYAASEHGWTVSFGQRDAALVLARLDEYRAHYESFAEQAGPAGEGAAARPRTGCTVCSGLLPVRSCPLCRRRAVAGTVQGPAGVGTPADEGSVGGPTPPADPGPGLCHRCHRAPGTAGPHLRFCGNCISRCHESTDFAHECAVCAGVPGKDDHDAAASIAAESYLPADPVPPAGPQPGVYDDPAVRAAIRETLSAQSTSGGPPLVGAELVDAVGPVAAVSGWMAAMDNLRWAEQDADVEDDPRADGA
jgi:hypothetical protein